MNWQDKMSFICTGIYLVSWGIYTFACFIIIITTPLKYLIATNFIVFIACAYSSITPFLCIYQFRALVEKYLELEES